MLETSEMPIVYKEGWAAKRGIITVGSEPHASIEIEKHATLFSCSTWLVAWIADAPYDDDDDVDVNIAAILQLIGERRGPKGRQAEHHNYTNRTTCMHRNRNPCNSFFMVNLASEMDRGRVRTTTTTSHNMAAIQLIPSHAVLVYGICLWYWIGHPCYGQLTPVKASYPLTCVRWPYRGLRLKAHRGHVFLSWPLTKYWLSIGSRARVGFIGCT